MNVVATHFALFTRLTVMTMTILSPQAFGSDTTGALTLTDFTPNSRDLGWYVVNDTVMGGRSSGDFTQDGGVLKFTGRTNTRGGGFSSIRTGSLRLDLSDHAGIRLKVKGDGRRYTWRLTTDARWRGRQITYRADFDTRNGTWSTVDLPFSSFSPGFRGYELNGPTLNAARIKGMGLMIYDKNDGPFEIHLGSVDAYTADTPFTLTRYHWRNRVLVISAPRQDDRRLQAQREAVAVTTEDFTDRDLVLITVVDDAPSTAGDRPLTATETAAVRVDLNIPSGSFALRLVGKDGSVKLSDSSTRSMAEIYTLIDSMPMRQSERARGHVD
ncbi:MAG: DUF4174 domain-containing protein [Gammaproteobacteria bacterium]|nr:DUF4174 domain-containing protein [Gammaproteobacteria bacterium]